MESSSFIEEIDYRELQFGEVVGKGAFGVVSRARWRGKDVAVKRIESEQEKKSFMQELKQLSRVSHPNIVCLYGACRDHPVCLVMEYAEGGSLYNVLHGSGPQPHYTAAHAMNWLLQCALGVEYLHGMKPKALIHRDLKPPNLLLIQCGTKLKICDFGTACDIHTHMTNNKGSAAWMAPEVFEGSNYSEKCDVFSWGIILWEVFTRRKPFDEIGGPAFRIMWAVHNGTRPPLIQGLPPPLEQLMTKCWSGKPAERPAMSEVVRIMSFMFQFFHGGDRPLTIARNSNGDSDDDFSINSMNHIPRTNISTPTNNVHLASPPVADSRTATIRNTVRHNQEIDIMESPPILRRPANRGTPPVVMEEKGRSQMSAPPSLAASRENLNEPRARSMTPVNSSNRFSGDSAQLDEQDSEISQGPAATLAVTGMTQVLSTPTQESRINHTQPPVHRCPTYPGELPHSSVVPPLNPPTSPPFRSISQQPPSRPSREGVVLYPRSLSTPDGCPIQESNANIQQGYNDAKASVHGAAGNTDSHFWAMEPHLQPMAPHPTNTESMRIFEEHCQLAQEYMRIQAEIAVLSRKKHELMQERERQTSHHSTNLADIEHYTRLSAENESLLKYHAHLKSQVETFRRNAKCFPASLPAQIKN